jgi:hypothetical protein
LNTHDRQSWTVKASNASGVMTIRNVSGSSPTHARKRWLPTPLSTPPLAGQGDLDSSPLMRLGIRDEYRSRQPDAWNVPVRASEAFDGLVHVRRMHATRLLGQRPWAEVDGVPVEVLGACSDRGADRLEVVFDGGSLSASLVYDEEWVLWFDATAVVDGITSAGILRVEEGDGWTFAGQLLSAEGGEATEIAGYVPYGLPGC